MQYLHRSAFPFASFCTCQFMPSPRWIHVRYVPTPPVSVAWAEAASHTNTWIAIPSPANRNPAKCTTPPTRVKRCPVKCNKTPLSSGIWSTLCCELCGFLSELVTVLFEKWSHHPTGPLIYLLGWSFLINYILCILQMCFIFHFKEYF